MDLGPPMTETCFFVLLFPPPLISHRVKECHPEKRRRRRRRRQLFFYIPNSSFLPQVVMDRSFRPDVLTATHLADDCVTILFIGRYFQHPSHTSLPLLLRFASHFSLNRLSNRKRKRKKFIANFCFFHIIDSCADIRQRVGEYNSRFGP